MNEKQIEPIKNVLDVPKPRLLDAPPLSMSVDLTFLESQDLGEIERGVKDVMQHVGFSILAIGIAFARIEKDALYSQAGYPGYLEYLSDAEDRIGMPVSTISDYKRIGENYMRYRSDLQKVRYDEKQGVHKLRYLDVAVKTHPKAEVFKKLVKLSYKEFSAWARGKFENKAEPQKVTVEVRENSIMIDGKNILNLPVDLPEPEREKLVDRLERIYQIEADGGEPYIVDTYGPGEQRAIDSFIKKFRGKK